VFIYAIIGSIASLIIVGIFVIMAVGICAIIFPILSAVKASKGEIWNYPCSITFFKTDIPQTKLQDAIKLCIDQCKNFFKTGIPQQTVVTTPLAPSSMSSATSPIMPSAPVQNYVTEEIKKMKELLDIGAVSQEDFDMFKKKILGNN
jgi:hypothetical protein